MEIYRTEDGSNTLYVPEIDECYHSTHGAIQESQHIFICAALHWVSKQHVSVFEVGFGTGLNAFLTLLDARERDVCITYTTIEKFPISQDVAAQLNFSDLVTDADGKALFMAIHNAPWNERVQITPNFSILKWQDDLCTFDVFTEKYDVIYFDAFSPEKQPELWNESIFRRLFFSTNEQAVLTTYCAKGVVRRTLQQVGFNVERLPGPPGKREILRALKG